MDGLYTMGPIGKTVGLKRYDGARKKINGTDLAVILLEVNGANPVFHLYFKHKRQCFPNFLLCNIQQLTSVPTHGFL